VQSQNVGNSKQHWINLEVAILALFLVSRQRTTQALPQMTARKLTSLTVIRKEAMKGSNFPSRKTELKKIKE